MEAPVQLHRLLHYLIEGASEITVKVWDEFTTNAAWIVGKQRKM